MNKAFLPTFERVFRVHIYGVKQRRNVYMFRTNRGMWVVKGYKDEEKAQWVTAVAEQLRARGFTRTVEYVQSASGDTVIPIGSAYYTVMKAIDGDEASYMSLTDVKRAIATLARFHLAARGFPPAPDMFYYKPPLIEKWESRLADFEEIAHSVEQKGAQNRFEELVLKMAPEVLEDGYQIIKNACYLPLLPEIHQAAIFGTLAHRDVASHNFLIKAQGSCYMIDLDTVNYDMQLVDVVQLISRMMLLQGYEMSAFSQAIEQYIKICPLSDSQIKLIHQLLRYPDNFLREVTGVYLKRPGYNLRGVMQLLQLEYKLRNRRRQFLQAEQPLHTGGGWAGYLGAG
ncbi:phosphotransferase [Brevibacillus massiliensis]|uniref:phosphotransferase n=2 Tax=Brevibacillus massiliensis TaxID=1118054 RepID=UPI00037D0FEA|nr:phosphotransferase [Brevibacillus massiliensis]